MSLRSIRTALTSYFKTREANILQGVAVTYDNRIFLDPAKTDLMATFMVIVDDHAQASVGAYPRKKHHGSVELHVHAPLGSGVATSEEILDRFSEDFAGKFISDIRMEQTVDYKQTMRHGFYVLTACIEFQSG